MQISNLIHDAKSNFITNTGQEPSSLYVGEIEWAHLKMYASEISFFEYSEAKNAGNEFLGMAIYRVKEESHLNVAA